jgi:hypothetical protein
VNIGDQFLRARDHGEYAVAPIHADVIAQFRELGLPFLDNIIWRTITTTRTTGGCTWMGSIYFPRDGYITYEHEVHPALPEAREGEATAEGDS